MFIDIKCLYNIFYFTVNLVAIYGVDDETRLISVHIYVVGRKLINIHFVNFSKIVISITWDSVVLQNKLKMIHDAFVL